MNEYAILGDQLTCSQLRLALSKRGVLALHTEDLEIQDELETRRWFARNPVAGVFICLGLLGQTSVNNFVFTLAGSLNVIRAAAGVAVGPVPRLILVSSFPSVEFFMLQRGVDLYFAEKVLDFYSMGRAIREDSAAFADRCVLAMCNVSAKKAHQTGPEGPHQGREVRDPVVPQSPRGQSNTAQGTERRSEGVPQQSASMLEVQEQGAESAASCDVRAECAAVNSPQTPHTVYATPGAIQGMVPADRVP